MKVNKKIINFFSALSDETRIKILLTLSGKSKSVTEIHNEVGKEGITLSAISHQLKLLSNTDIVISEKKGREKYYSRSNDFCWCILKDAFRHFDKKTSEKLKKFNLKR